MLDDVPDPGVPREVAVVTHKQSVRIALYITSNSILLLSLTYNVSMIDR